MKKLVSLFSLVSLIAFGSLSCSSDDGPTGGGGGDTTAPEIAGVTAIDQSHVNVTFSEVVTKPSAERSDHYVVTTVTRSNAGTQESGALADTVHTLGAVLAGDGKTVMLSMADFLTVQGYMLVVHGVADPSGNVIKDGASAPFTGSDAIDTTPPELVSRYPAPGATNVGIGESVVLQFSEPIDGLTLGNGFQWVNESGPVLWEMEQVQASTYAFHPRELLPNNVNPTVTVSGGVADYTGNRLLGGTVFWTYHTTSQEDNTPPTLDESTPRNGTSNVSVTTNLSLTFSEAVDQTSLQEVFLFPDVGPGVDTWSADGRTITFDPENDLLDNTQYKLIIVPGGVRDLAGNGNTAPITVVWSTGPTFSNGGIRGMIFGDPMSAQASDPTGAIVAAADRNPFGPSDDFVIKGIDVVADNDTYAIINLPDGWYFPLSVMDSNGDGELEPDRGDAFGLYGVDFESDFDADSVNVFQGGTAVDVNFQLFDPMAITGQIIYNGAQTGEYVFFVGVFDTTGFDPTSSPDFGTQGFWPYDPTFAIDELDQGLAPGTYYIGAYLDIEFTGVWGYDPLVDPAGLYGGSQPIPVTLDPGEDLLDIVIPLFDPPAVRSAPDADRPPVAWGRTYAPHSAEFRALMARVKRALAEKQ